MRLLKQDRDGALVMKEFFESNIPAYVVLSHTWGAKNDEVTFTDFIGGIWRTKPGAAKLLFCAKQAARDGYLYFWIDSCCINKANHTELSEAINSMFRWYRDAKRCYVYLSDVPPPSENPLWQSAFDRSLWFTRGWTLQELLAPQDVVFFSTENGTEDSEILGCKDTLRDDIHDITGIPVEALQSNDFSEFSLHERMSWAERRNTTRPEDRAYCLIGILGISMGLRYGERDKEWERLTHKVNELSTNPQSARRLSSNSSPKVYMRRFIVITAIFALLVAWISNHFSLPIPSPLSSTPPPLPSSSAIFAIIGRTGAGKSTFIKALGARDSKGRYPQASDQLEPCTGDITFYKFSIHDTEAYIIDTPGFGDGNMSDTRVMMDIFDELNKLSLEGNKIRLIYLYDISLSKFDIEAHKNLAYFESLVGLDNAESVALVTGKWRSNPTEEDTRLQLLREDALKETYWKGMLEVGTKYERHDGSSDSARLIIQRLLQKPVMLNREPGWVREQLTLIEEREKLKRVADEKMSQSRSQQISSSAWNWETWRVRELMWAVIKFWTTASMGLISCSITSSYRETHSERRTSSSSSFRTLYWSPSFVYDRKGLFTHLESWVSFTILILALFNEGLYLSFLALLVLNSVSFHIGYTLVKHFVTYGLTYFLQSEFVVFLACYFPVCAFTIVLDVGLYYR